VATLLPATSTKILLNGSLGDKICHACGLRQADPLYSILFILVMEVLNALIQHADSWLLHQQLGPWCIHYRTSMYADDLVIFFYPVAHDLQVLHTIFTIFEGSLGLGCNINNYQLIPIQCSEEQIVTAMNIFPHQLAAFPLKYLGMLLPVAKLQRSAL
jgi:hypothetical protein